MKLSIAIANTNALPSAFVVYRGFEECIPKIARMGFQGVELALKRAGEINVPRLEHLLDSYGLEVSCISTGQVYADGGLMLTHNNAIKRKKVICVFRDLIDLAGQFGKLINIGRVRGQVGDRSPEYVEKLFVETVSELAEYAAKRKVGLMIEPVNRYETDFINSVEEAAALLKRSGLKNVSIMPDVFHMNIEDRNIGEAIAKHIDRVEYVHLADSNRFSPGQGHIDFEDIFDKLFAAGFDGWASVEILPKPSPDVAAERAADFLLPMIRQYNQKQEKGLIWTTRQL